jgi:hypothetical protein
MSGGTCLGFELVGNRGMGNRHEAVYRTCREASSSRHFHCVATAMQLVLKYERPPLRVKKQLEDMAEVWERLAAERRHHRKRAQFTSTYLHQARGRHRLPRAINGSAYVHDLRTNRPKDKNVSCRNVHLAAGIACRALCLPQQLQRLRHAAWNFIIREHRSACELLSIRVSIAIVGTRGTDHRAPPLLICDGAVKHTRGAPATGRL